MVHALVKWQASETWGLLLYEKVGDAHGLWYKSRILVSLKVLMTNNHHY